MISRKLFVVLYIISIWALIRTHSASTTLFNNLFELFLVILATLNSTKIHKKVIILFIISLSYFFGSIAYVLLISKNNILDFLLIYKFFVYAIFLSILFKKQIIHKQSFIYFYKFLFALYTIKYSSITLLQRTRPTLFYENNFELMMLALMFYLYYVIKGKVSIQHQLLLATIFIFSKSISALLILLFVLGMINRKQIIKKIYIIIPGIVLLAVAGIYVLKDRMDGKIDFTNHDRYKFLTVFLNETENWNFANYLFGASRITHLSESACRKLGYWDTLFSYSGDGTCYSVVLHSYLFRVIFDHGFVGLLFIVYFVYSIIIRSGYSRYDALTVVGIVFINGLSVSSFNSVYFAIGILFYIVVHEKNKVPTKTLIHHE